MRTKTGHNQIRRQIKHNIANVEQGQTRRDLVRIQMQNMRKVMTRARVHRLRQTDVGADGRAHEVENPEGGNNAPIQLSVPEGQYSIKFRVFWNATDL